MDYTGHGFATVYSNSTYAGRALLKNHIEQQLSSLKDEDEFSVDYSTYTWYLATEKNSGGSINPDNSNYEIEETSANCFDWDFDEAECTDWYNEDLRIAHATKISAYAQAHCWDQCNESTDFADGYAPTIRWPGEVNYDNAWYVSANGENALEQFLFLRIFNPANPAYVGFSKSNARIKYQKFDTTPYIWAQYPLWDPGPIDFQLILPKKVYVGVKACVSPQQ